MRRAPIARCRSCAIVSAWTFAALLAAGHVRADIVGRVVTVHDGDTLTVLADRQHHRVRLVGIDAPERGQPYANASRDALADRVAGREVRVIARGRDPYGRMLGRVFVDGLDVNAEQVRAGYAWAFGRHADAPLVALEAEARAARRGLWRDMAPVAPWQWRERRPPAPARPPLERAA